MKPILRKVRGTAAGAWAAMLCLATSFVGAGLEASGANAASLPHEAYVWQRVWRPAVTEAVANAAPALSGFVVLAAEIDSSRTIVVTPDYALLAASGRPVGLALRFGTMAPAEGGSNAERISELARQVLAEASTAGLRASELQLDFDCPDSRLEAYRDLVKEVRRQIAPTPLTITSLPTWLRQPAFQGLVEQTDGFVLQVHSLDEALTLCDSAAARAAVAQASLCGVPFRVALPTYGYRVGMAPDGTLAGVQAEGPQPSWPAGTVIREVRSDPAQLAELVQGWSAQPPANLAGFLWYRLPLADDQLNWRWPTLATIVNGGIPRPALAVAVRQPSPGLVEIDLVNLGDADASGTARIAMSWSDATLLACDALAGFSVAGSRDAPRRLQLVGTSRLAPLERSMMAWLRFSEAKEIRCDAQLE